MSTDSKSIPQAIGRDFALRAIFVIVVTAGLLAIAAASVLIIDTLLILFGAILFSLTLSRLGDEIARRAKISRRHGVLCGTAVLAIVVLASGLLVGPSINAEIQQAGPKFSSVVEDISQQAERQDWLAKVKKPLNESDVSLQQIISTGFLPSATQKMFATSFGLLTSLALVLIIGFWIAWNPGVYKSLAIKLVPMSHRDHAGNILDETGMVLTNWVLGRLLAMLTVGVLVTISLLMLGVPLPFTLGILAGIISFVPTIGAFLAIIPALLFAIPQGGEQVGFVLACYLAIQLLENNLITPLVMERAVSIPAAFVLIMQLAMGMLVGGLGVAFAVPIAAALSVLIRRLYVQDFLGDNQPNKLEPSGGGDADDTINCDSRDDPRLKPIGSES